MLVLCACLCVCVYMFHVWGTNACAHAFTFMCMAHGDRLVETWGFFLDGSTLLLSRDLIWVQIVQLDNPSRDSLCAPP